jgi:hypothetical protein
MIDQPLARVAQSAWMSCCPSVLFGTDRMFRCCMAVQVTSASLVSFFCRRTNGFTY